MKLTMKIALFILIVTMLLIGFVFADTFTNVSFPYETNDFKYIQRNVSYNNSGYFYIRKIDFKVSDKVYQTSFIIPGTTGTIRYANSNNELVEAPLAEGFLPTDVMLHIQTDKYNMLLGQGYTYKDMGSGTIESVSSKAMYAKKQNENWLITYTYNMQKDCFGILWGMGSNKELINFKDENQIKVWSNYDLDKKARLGYEGYYYKSPDSYVPYTENSYWRIPTSYITNSLVKTGGSLAADIMGNALLIIAKDAQSNDGYFPSLPNSNWLAKDYNIGAGFFDTRFNADTMETYIIAYQKYKNPMYREVYLKMADYYLAHGGNNHYPSFDATGIEGWLVEDYSYNNNHLIQTHVSLNHQLQAIHVFLMLYEIEREQKYLDFTNKLLYGIKNTRDKWIMPDSNLVYAYMANGEMGLNDYPFLTYNDLYNVQSDLFRLYGTRDADLDKLMEAKKIWMDNNNISGYRK